MNSRVTRGDAGVGVSVIVSAVIHLAVFLLLVWWGELFPPQITIQETYYVDVVTLPVANPRSGSPVQKSGEAEAISSPVPAPTMTAPTPSVPALKNSTKNVTSRPSHESGETEAAFNERMAKLERNSEARHEEAMLEKLQSSVKARRNAKSGMPDAGGVDAGSRYADYIKSRLEDALKITSSFTTKKPEVAVRLTIGADGKLLRIKVERSSGDATFELAVRRAIDLASEKFTAPPNRAVFENGFLFRPKGITNGTPR